MKNKDSGTRTGLAPATNPLSALSPVEADRKRRRRRTNSTATNDASSNLSATATPTAGLPIESPVVTPTATVPTAQMSVPSTPPTPSVLPPTPVKRQHRTPSKVSVVVTEGEDSQDDSILPDETDGQGSGSVDNESSSNKKKLVKKQTTELRKTT